MKKIISTICLIALIVLNFNITPIFAASFSEDDVSVKFANSKAANLYYEDEVPSLRITISNDNNLALSGVCTYTVKNLAGIEVLNLHRDISVSEYMDKSFTQKLNMNDIGGFTVDVTLGGNFGNITKSLTFAILKKSDIRNEKIGTILHFDLNEREDKLNETHALTEIGGFSWVRDDLRWERCQTEKGGAITIPAYRDAEINAHIEAGNNVLLVLGYGNTNYENRFPKTNEEIEAYANYCKAVAEHYKGKIDTFEIYNEPDNESFAGWSITGADYVKVLKAAAGAIRSVQPDATIIGGSLCSMRHSTARARTIATQIFADSTVTDYMDAFSFHSYDYDSPYGLYSDEDTRTNFKGQIDFIKNLIKKSKNPNLPIWITEDGMPSAGGEGIFVIENDELIQAADTARVLADVAANTDVEKYFIYNLHAKNHSTVTENAFGIVDKDYNVKPAYITAAFSNYMLNGAECIQKFEAGTASYKRVALGGYGFKKDDKEIYVAWEHFDKTATFNINKTGASWSESVITSGSASATLTVANNAEVRIYDMYGNRMNYSETIDLTVAPVYIEVVPSKTSFTRNGNTVTVTGFSDIGNSDITLIAKDKENTEKILALKQIKSSSTGEFTITVDIPQDKSFYIYVYDENIKESADYGNVEFSLTPELLINSEKDYNLNDLKTGDTVKLNLDVEATTPKNLVLYGAVYKNSGALLKVDKKDVEFTNGKASAQIEFYIENSEDVNNIKYMLWDSNLTPVANAVTFE